MSERKLEILKLIKQLGRKILPNNAELLLFGSQARNDARAESDWDLLILINREQISDEDFNQIVFPFISLGWSLNIEINPVVYTFEQWQRRNITPFYKNVMNEGVRLC